MRNPRLWEVPSIRQRRGAAVKEDTGEAAKLGERG